MTLNQHQIARLRGRLAELYGDQADACLARLLTLVSHHPSPGPRHTADWDQRDVLLVCYGDQVQAPGRPHLQTLLDFLTAYDLPALPTPAPFAAVFPQFVGPWLRGHRLSGRGSGAGNLERHQ